MLMMLPNKPADLDDAMGSRHLCTQPTMQSCVGVALMAETVYHNLGRPQEKAVVPDFTARPEDKSLITAQTACQCCFKYCLSVATLCSSIFSIVEAL